MSLYPPPPPPEPMWRVHQVAAFLGVSEIAVRKMIHAGRIRGVVQPGGKIYLIPASTIREMAGERSA